MKYIIEYFWIFVLGSFIGWAIETLWCILKNKKYESRKGLIYGYFIPIYGIAALLISCLVKILSIKNFALFFLLTFLICGGVEYISSLIQERYFGTKSWDYSKMKLNINGRVNLLYLLLFSILGIFWCNYYAIVIAHFTKFLDKFNLLNVGTLLFLIFMIYNCVISVLASYRQKTRKNGVKAKNKLEYWLDKKFNDEYMKRIYANAKFIE